MVNIVYLHEKEFVQFSGHPAEKQEMLKIIFILDFSIHVGILPFPFDVMFSFPLHCFSWVTLGIFAI